MLRSLGNMIANVHSADDIDCDTVFSDPQWLPSIISHKSGDGAEQESRRWGGASKRLVPDASVGVQLREIYGRGGRSRGAAGSKLGGSEAVTGHSVHVKVRSSGASDSSM